MPVRNEGCFNSIFFSKTTIFPELAAASFIFLLPFRLILKHGHCSVVAFRVIIFFVGGVGLGMVLREVVEDGALWRCSRTGLTFSVLYNYTHKFLN